MSLTPNKTYYSISEVCEETGLEPHVLRYWEMEFHQLRPKKNRAGNRAYRMHDIKIIKFIRYLLYEEEFTIQGAKKKMNERRNYEISPQLELGLENKSNSRLRQALYAIRSDLEQLLRQLKQ